MVGVVILGALLGVGLWLLMAGRDLGVTGAPAAPPDRGVSVPVVPPVPVAEPHQHEEQQDISAPGATAESVPEAPPASAETVTEQPMLDPLTSDEIPRDNGAHFFVLATELFPDVDMGRLMEKWAEARANDFRADAELRMMLERFRLAFEAFERGLEVGNIRMPAPRAVNDPMPYLTRFRDLGQVMAIEAELRAAAGNINGAFENYSILLRFSAQTVHGGSLLHTMVSASLQDMGTQSLRRVLDWKPASSEQYRYMVSGLKAAEEAMPGISTILLNEAQRYEILFEQARREGKTVKELIVGATGASDLFAEMSDEELEERMSAVLSDYQEVAQLFEKPYSEVRAVDLSALLGDHPLSEDQEQTLERLHTQYFLNRAQVRGTCAMAAVEWYGAENDVYPKAIGDLVPKYLAEEPMDPFTDAPFGYGLTDAGYFLYSAGPDMIDDGCTDGPWHQPGSDVVFRSMEGQVL